MTLHADQRLTPRERAERLLQMLDQERDPAERLWLATLALRLQRDEAAAAEAVKWAKESVRRHGAGRKSNR